MNIRRSAFLACAVLPAALAAAAWAGPPVAAELREASVAVGYETRDRCPGLIQTNVQEPSAALIVLVVGPSGVPSQPSIRTSSGSESLDTAALSCVRKLRYLPAVRAGEGSARSAGLCRRRSRHLQSEMRRLPWPGGPGQGGSGREGHLSEC